MISRREALKRIFGIVVGIGFAVFFAKNVLADIVFRGKDGSDILEFIYYNESNGLVTLGKAGHIELGDSTERDLFPNTSKKINVGTSTYKMNKGFFGGLVDASGSGVRTLSDSDATISNPPTDAQLDSILGTPASLGAGWHCFLEDTTDNDYWFVMTDGTSWYVEELTKAV